MKYTLEEKRENKMKKIVMFDTSYGTQNVGDFIINEAINRQLDELLNKNFIVRYSTHTPIQKFFQNFRKNFISSFCQSADLKFLCGTNIFTYNLLHFNPNFNINPMDIKNYKNVISVGCGMTPAARKVNPYTKFIYKRILSKDYIHSTRDEKTKELLTSLGVNAINTGCPTMWSLTPEHCRQITKKKSNKVIFTLTDYKAERISDQKLIDILISNYEQVYFWVQGSDDLEYFNSFKNTDSIEIVNPNLESYRQLLTCGDIDYVGTRLHAGIFAMQHLVRSIIIIVDNRARDIKENYNIPTIEREEIGENLEMMINSDFITDVKINQENIDLWKKQFLD